MKVPPKRKGNNLAAIYQRAGHRTSMKVPPKRKGNAAAALEKLDTSHLNESPSEKEGKSGCES